MTSIYCVSNRFTAPRDGAISHSISRLKYEAGKMIHDNCLLHFEPNKLSSVSCYFEMRYSIDNPTFDCPIALRDDIVASIAVNRKHSVRRASRNNAASPR